MLTAESSIEAVTASTVLVTSYMSSFELWGLLRGKSQAQWKGAFSHILLHESGLVNEAMTCAALSMAGAETSVVVIGNPLALPQSPPLIQAALGLASPFVRSAIERLHSIPGHLVLKDIEGVQPTLTQLMSSLMSRLPHEVGWLWFKGVNNKRCPECSFFPFHCAQLAALTSFAEAIAL